MDTIRLWSQKELELIHRTLAAPASLRSPLPLQEHRDEAIGRFKSHFKDSTTGEALEGIDPSDRSGFDKYGSDLLTIKSIRHSYSNYNSFWKGQPQGPLGDMLWLVGFLKVQETISRQFPELRDAVTLETIKRVSAKDRAILRETILILTDLTKVQVPNVPYSELRTAAAHRLSERLQVNENGGATTDNTVTDERLREEIVNEFLTTHCEPAIFGLGISLLHNYHKCVVRDRVCAQALSALSDYYPELADECESRMDGYRATTTKRMNIKVGDIRSVIYAPNMRRVLARTVEDYNNEHISGILKGTEANLCLNGAPQVLRAKILPLALSRVLTQFSRYEEFMDIAGSLPEPMASEQKVKVRLVFLSRVQERYPEFKEVIQEEVRLLTPESQGGFIGQGLLARLSA